MALPEAKLDAIIARHQAVEDELATAPERDRYVKLSRDCASAADSAAS